MPSYRFKAKDDKAPQMHGRAMRHSSPERAHNPEPKTKTNIKKSKKKRK